MAGLRVDTSLPGSMRESALIAETPQQTADEFLKTFKSNQNSQWNQPPAENKYLDFEKLLVMLEAIKDNLDNAEMFFKNELDNQATKVEHFYEELINELSSPNNFFYHTFQFMTDPLELAVCVQQIEDFASHNLQAFRKIIDVHDSISRSTHQLSVAYSWKKNRMEFCPADWMDQILSRLSSLYDEYGERKIENVLEGPSGAPKNKHTFWVPKNQVVKLSCGLLKLFPVDNVTSGPETDFADHTNSVHFDDLKLTGYNRRMRGDTYSLVNFHWGSAYEDGRVAIMKRKYPRFPGQAAEVALMPHNKIPKFLQGELNERDLDGSGGRTKHEREVLESARKQITEKNLRPSIKIEFMKTVFKFSGDNTVIVKLSTRINMIRELDAGAGGRDSGVNWASPSMGDPEHSIHHFPFAVLTVKTPDKQTPKWLKTLVEENGLERIGGFSKFIHGTAILYKDLIDEHKMPLPKWVDPSRQIFTTTTPDQNLTTSSENLGTSTYFGPSHYGAELDISQMSPMGVGSRNRANSAIMLGSERKKSHATNQGMPAAVRNTPRSRRGSSSMLPQSHQRSGSVGEPLHIQFGAKDPKPKDLAIKFNSVSNYVNKNRGISMSSSRSVSSKVDDIAQFPTPASDIELAFYHASSDNSVAHLLSADAAGNNATEKDRLVTGPEKPNPREVVAVETKEDDEAVPTAKAEPTPDADESMSSPPVAWTVRCGAALRKCFCLSEEEKRKRLLVEPKTFFANERTFLQWFSTAALISSVALALMGMEGGDVAIQSIGYIFLPIAILILSYAFGVFYYRVKKLSNLESNEKFADVWGPLGLTMLMVLALIAAMLIKGGVIGGSSGGVLQLNSKKYVLNECYAGELRYGMRIAGLSLGDGSTLNGVADSTVFEMKLAEKVQDRLPAVYRVPLLQQDGTASVKTTLKGISSVRSAGEFLVGVVHPITGVSSVILVRANEIANEFALPEFNSTSGNKTQPAIGIIDLVSVPTKEKDKYLVVAANSFDSRLYAYEINLAVQNGEGTLQGVIQPLQGSQELSSLAVFEDNAHVLVTYQKPAVHALLRMESVVSGLAQQGGGSFDANTVRLYDSPDMPSVAGMALDGSVESAVAYVCSDKYEAILKYTWTGAGGFSQCITS